MKKTIFCIFICTLLLVSAVLPLTTASYQERTQNDGSETQGDLTNSNVRRGFFIGYFDTITQDGERWILFDNGRGLSGPFPVTYVLPLTLYGPYFRLIHIPHSLQQLSTNEQIQLINPKYCLIFDHFIIGFSQMLFPDSKLSMHIISQLDEFNQVRWVIDGIEGDEVWGGNLKAELFNPDGARATGHTTMGPYPWKAEYLSVGDEMFVKNTEDGFYQMKVFDTVTGRVLYSSPFIHF